MVDVICVFGIQGTKVADFLKGLKSWKQTHPVSIRLKKNRKKKLFFGWPNGIAYCPQWTTISRNLSSLSKCPWLLLFFMGSDHFLWHIFNFVDIPHTRTINHFVSANEDVVNIQCTSCAEQQPRWQIIYYVRRCSFTLSKPFGCSTCFDSVTNFFCVFSLNSIHKFQKQVFFVFVFHCPNHLGTPPASTVSPVVCEVSFLGLREPLVLPLVDPPVPKENLDHLYTYMPYE